MIYIIHFTENSHLNPQTWPTVVLNIQKFIDKTTCVNL